jgi:hypothetical protein
MSLRATAVATLIAAVVLAGASAPAAVAGCGAVETQKAGKALGDFRAPLIVGDSVLLGAIPQVARLGFDVDAHGCRQWSEGARIVRLRKRRGTLPHMVAMFLGADWTVSKAQIQEVLFRLGPKRVLVLVTPREVGGRGGTDAQHMRDMAERYPTRIFLLDWVRYTRHRPSWFAPDGLHLNRPGIPGLAGYLKRSLKYAAPGTAPPAPPSDTPPPTGA